jgi:RHS repeat-associated protein
MQRYIYVPADTQAAGVFEEYHYDALSRRVMVIARGTGRSPGCDSISTTMPCAVLCSIGCDGQPRVTWTTWDGAQIVSEERRQFADGTIIGNVEYVHGLALDHPLAALDGNLTNGVRVLNPHWRGGFESSVTETGAGADCTIAPGAGCQKIEWPAGQAVYARPGPIARDALPYTWAGSLLTDQQDGTGQLYRRSRYYDPDAGRFTQEDPIGLAGGMNLYGFAGGDPVNYADPFGLCPDPKDPICRFSVGRGAYSGAGFGAVLAGIGGKAEALMAYLASSDTWAGAGMAVLLSMDGGVGDVGAVGLGTSMLRGEFESVVRPAIWRAEAAGNAGAYSTDNLARMRLGKAAIGSDGFPMEIHHRQALINGGTTPGPIWRS